MNTSELYVCVVGLGSIGRRYAKILADSNINVDVVSTGLGSLTSDTALPIQSSEVPFNRRYSNINDAIDNKYDFWILATPSSFHAEQLTSLMRSGHNVFCEKPVATTKNDVKNIRAILTGYRGRTGVAYTLRAHPLVRKLKETIVNGELGKPVSGSINWSSYLPDWHPWEDYKVSYAAQTELGGGAALTMSHEIDLALYLFGEPKNTHSYISSYSHLGINADDNFDALLQCHDNTIVHIHLAFHQKNPRRHTVIEFNSGGRAILDLQTHTLRYGVEHEKHITLDQNSGSIWGSIYKDQLNNYISWVRNDTCSLNFASIDEALAISVIATNHN